MPSPSTRWKFIAVSVQSNQTCRQTNKLKQSLTQLGRGNELKVKTSIKKKGELRVQRGDTSTGFKLNVVVESIVNIPENKRQHKAAHVSGSVIPT